MNIDTNKIETNAAALRDAVNTIVSICHAMNAKWWVDPETGAQLQDNPLIVPTKLALVHSEVSEALEGHRCDKPDDKLPQHPAVVAELADVLIRVGDLAGAMGYRLGDAVYDKTIFNTVRADHKLENRVKKGGKRY